MTARSLPPSFSGKLAQMPWDAGSRKQRLERSRQRQIVDQNPANFVPEFDVIYELQENRENYSVARGDDCSNLTILGFPSICSISLDTIRTKVGKPKPGIHTTISCCMFNGLKVLNDNDHIQSLVALKGKFDLSDIKSGADEISAVSDWFNSFNMDMPSDGKRRTVRLPSSIGSDLSSLSSEIGITQYSLAIIAIMETISDQICVNKQYAKTMSEHVAKFLNKARIRSVGTGALMEAFNL